MLKQFCYIVMVAIMIAEGAVIAAEARADSPLVINEILAGPARDWDGSGAFSSRDDEWVEMFNAGGATLDLNGYFLTDGDSIPRYAFTGDLAPGGHLVVYGKTSFDWEHANGFPAFGLSLGNSGDAVLLWHVSGSDTTLVDSHVFGSHEAAADRAVGRSPDGGPDWALFDGLDPYTGSTAPTGTGCMPTPGEANLCNSTPTAPVTWGRIKAIYH
ncbi:MAG TPA: lamin tail domain-containing protein [Candidatus Sulfotelmatobacter sp.]|nr:lamin tail domain-containing protein [Candidatus Sulfotelmatobacter sp.]